MAHVRQQIRDQVVTNLTGLSTTAARVYPSRVYPAGDDSLPCLCIYTDGEEVEREDSETQRRRVTLRVEGYVKAASDVDDTLDDISAEVETALFADEFLNGIAKGIDLAEVEKALAHESEQPVGIVTMIFTAHCMTAVGAPETPQ